MSVNVRGKWVNETRTGVRRASKSKAKDVRVSEEQSGSVNE